MSATVFAFLVSLAAGLSTGIGGLVPLFTNRRSTRFLCFSLGLSAGVMVYVSFMEMLPEAIDSLSRYYTKRTAGLMALGFLLAGMALIAIIDKLVPEDENPHEFGHEQKGGALRKMGLLSALAIAVHNFPEGLASFMSALAIAVHNFPEGLASFMSALDDPVSGVSVAIAIALHNIPEGITVASPIYHSSGSRTRAFLYALGSGIAEPLGAVVGFMFLQSVFTPFTFALVYALVAGIMIYLAFDELLPTAENYGHHHLVTYAVILGMVLMGVTLALL